MRLFVAIDLPETVQERLAGLSCGLPGARRVPPEQLHLTLRFIGEVDAALMQDIHHALSEVTVVPFFLQLAGVGFFPPRKQPQLIWAGVEKNEQLVRLRNRIEYRLVRLGLEPERRKFFPHITLARLRRTPSSRVAGFMQEHSLFYSTPFQVTRFRLYSSVLNSRGSRHYPEQEYLLSSA